MNNTTVNYTPSHSNLSTSAAPAALKQVAAQNSAKSAAPVDTAAATAITKADQTSLSLASGLVTKALSLPDVRHEKIAGLQKAIASGTYNVSSHDVAGKLIQSLLG